MKLHTSLVVQQSCLSEWDEMIRDCQSRPEVLCSSYHCSNRYLLYGYAML